MKKFFLLFTIALVLPAATHCGENDNGRFSKTTFVVGGLLVVGILYGAGKYWLSSSPTTTPADNPTLNTNNAPPSHKASADTVNLQQDIQEKLTPPVSTIPLNKVIPVSDVPDEDHKIVENALNASQKPREFSLSNSFEKVSNRANPANIDHATNDYLDIIIGY